MLINVNIIQLGDWMDRGRNEGRDKTTKQVKRESDGYNNSL